MTTIDRVQRVIARALNRHIDDVPTLNTLDQLGVDSIDRLEIELSLEDEFDVHFGLDQGIDTGKTVGDLAARVDLMLATVNA